MREEVEYERLKLTFELISLPVTDIANTISTINRHRKFEASKNAVREYKRGYYKK